MYEKRFLNASKVKELLVDGLEVSVVELIVQGNVSVEKIIVFDLDPVSEFVLNKFLVDGNFYYEIKTKGSNKILFSKIQNETTANKILEALV